MWNNVALLIFATNQLGKMGSYFYLYYHIVIVVDKRENVITENNEQRLYDYIGAFFRNRQSHLVIVNGVEDHLHLLVSLHPTKCLSDIMRDLKTATNKFIKEEKLFPKFKKWQNGYAAFSVSHYKVDTIRNYIARQKQHHSKTKVETEYKAILDAHQLSYNPNDVFGDNPIN